MSDITLTSIDRKEIFRLLGLYSGDAFTYAHALCDHSVSGKPVFSDEVSDHPVSADGAFTNAASANHPGIDDPLLAQINRCETTVLRIAQPKAVWRILPVSSMSLPGNDIAKLLDGCSNMVLMAVTLGIPLERELIRLESVDISDAMVTDVCASAAVEQAADQEEAIIRNALQEEGGYLTNRYSPGYGDFPLSMQRDLLTALDAGRRIGLTITEHDLMIPRKSVTAVMGISELPKKNVYGTCAHCPIRTKCSYRAHGSTCYS